MASQVTKNWFNANIDRLRNMTRTQLEKAIERELSASPHAAKVRAWRLRKRYARILTNAPVAPYKFKSRKTTRVTKNGTPRNANLSGILSAIRACSSDDLAAAVRVYKQLGPDTIRILRVLHLL